MKYVFLALTALLSILSGIAYVWRPAPPDDRIQLVWATDDNPVRRAQLQAFNEQNPTYRVKIDPTPVGLEKVIVQCLAGVGADLIDAYDGFQLAAYVRSGIALDITEEMAIRGIDPDDYWPALEPLYMLNGRICGLPRNAHAPAIWYNKDLFDEAGIPYPEKGWTWSEFVSTAQSLTVRDAQGRPVRFGFSSSKTAFEYTIQLVLQLYGASVYTPEGTAAAIDTPEAAAAFDFVKDLIYTFHVMPTPAEEVSLANAGGWGMAGGITQFGSGQAAMALGGRWWLCILRLPDYRDLRLGAVEIPHDEGEHILGGGAGVTINSHSEHIDGALEFLEYLHGPTYNHLTNSEADAIAPVMQYSYTDDFLQNPEYPDEDFHEVWREAMRIAAPAEMSPYVAGQRVAQLFIVQTDLLRLNKKSGTEAARDLAEDINEAIVEQLRIDPELRKQYYQAVKNGAKKAWTREEDAP